MKKLILFVLLALIPVSAPIVLNPTTISAYSMDYDRGYNMGYRNAMAGRYAPPYGASYDYLQGYYTGYNDGEYARECQARGGSGYY